MAAVLNGISLDAGMRTQLAAALGDTADRLWAVRSSTSVEDGHQHSHAGLYESVLHAHGVDGVSAAIICCWRSFYAPRAVLARLRAGDTDPSPRMAVIVQHMTDPALAGVAFTQPDRVAVSAVVGLGDRLVAGTTDAATVDVRPSNAPPPYADIARLATDLRRHLGHDIDMEWSWNTGGLQLLQVRPVTADLPTHRSTGPRFGAASLYFTDTLPADFSLGDIATTYLAVTAKRAHLYVARR